VLLGVACSGEVEPRRGQLMVVLQTDMSIPRDFTRIKVIIRVAGKVEHDATYAVAPDGSTKLPGTIAVVAGSEASAPVEVRVIGIADSGEAQTFSKSITTLPRDRLATLRVPLQWLCVGNVVQTGRGDSAEYESACEMEDGEETGCVAGRCKKVVVAEETLAEYQAPEVFGGGSAPEDPSGTCFDTQACFSLGFRVDPVLEEGSEYCRVRVTAPLDRTLNFAIQTAANGPGICDERDPGAPCFVPLDENDDFGFRVLAPPAPDRDNPALETHEIALPEGVCDRLVLDPSLAVVATAACPSKTAAIPTCGPWSATRESTDDDVAYDDLWAAVADAYCTGIAGCCQAADLPFDLESCKQERESILEAFTASFEELSFEYDPVAAASCLRVYQRTTAACVEDSDAVDAACDAVFQGQLADGQPCESTEECSETGSTCEGIQYSEDDLFNPIAPGICAPNPLEIHGEAGDPCRATCTGPAQECYSSVGSEVIGGVACYAADGLFCEITSFDQLGACRELAAEGAACTSDDTCEPGMYCAYDMVTFMTRCQPKVDSGPCTSFSACVDGSYCDAAGMCQPKRAAGEPCLSFDDCISEECTPEGVCAGYISETDCSGGIF
jgi:hypothetical protein